MFTVIEAGDIAQSEKVSGSQHDRGAFRGSIPEFT